MRWLSTCLAFGLLVACGGGQKSPKATGSGASAGNEATGGSGTSAGGATSPTGGGAPVARPAVTIDPPAFTIFIGKTVQLSAAVAEVSNQSVTWAVTEADCGEVSDSGLYTAPEALPDPAVCHVRATSVEDKSLSGEGRMIITDQASGGPPGEWVNLPISVGAYASDAGGAQTVVVDPVRPSDFYAFVSPADNKTTYVFKSTDFGLNWKDVNTTAALQGTPWGAAIDPNPQRDPETPPTLFCPAGFGAYGMWKSVDGGKTWTDMFVNDKAFAPYSPFGNVDAYQAIVLPDNPPNHLLVTYHYGFKGAGDVQTNDGGIGESTDGGKTWVVHAPPAGFGNSHYIMPFDSQTWLTIAQRNDGKNGIWKTSTAGRVGGKIDPAAWKKVDTHEHAHGSFQHYLDPKSGVLYVPGFNGVRRTTDKGDTWDWAEQNSGYTSSVIGTENYLYSNYRDGPQLRRATRSSGTDWAKYADEPEGMLGAPPYGNAASFDGQHWILVLGGHKSGLWRYVEP